MIIVEKFNNKIKGVLSAFDNHKRSLTATTDCITPEVTIDLKLGAIGVDLNAGFIAGAEVDRFGNPHGEFSIPVDMNNRKRTK